ncbi:hypothetical protein HFO17_35390, partial [Rhizobium laguerreae]|nr:hypothetical protein [Rhizobium laguerreae]
MAANQSGDHRVRTRWFTTCALWGLTFIAPRAVAPFTAWDLTIARYGIFGLACLMLLADRRFRPMGIARSRLLI